MTTATRDARIPGAGALRVSPDIELPLETVTQAVAILARRRAGKSYTAARLAEELLNAGQQVVVLDPKGDWWGLRSSADGQGPGLPILILGGERGDLPLEPGSGELVARFVVERGASALLDLSGFRKVAVRRGRGEGSASDLATFAGDFLEALYRLKAREANRTTLMLVIDRRT